MKFSIRDIILVTVIVAILAAWWVDHRDLRQRLDGLESETVQRREGNLRLYEEALFLSDKNKELREELRESRLPNSQAPAPNPPKP